MPDNSRYKDQLSSWEVGGTLGRASTQEPRARILVYHLIVSQLRATHFYLLNLILLSCEIKSLILSSY